MVGQPILSLSGCLTAAFVVALPLVLGAFVTSPSSCRAVARPKHRTTGRKVSEGRKYERAFKDSPMAKETCQRGTWDGDFMVDCGGCKMN